ncbi:MAG: L,D-transpeptidase family protein, partial [Xanthobacteraceae bacterium]
PSPDTWSRSRSSGTLSSCIPILRTGPFAITASPTAEAPANKPQAESGGDEVPATSIVNTAPIVVSTESTPATTAPASPAAEAPANEPQAASGGDEVPAAGAVNAAPIVASTESTTAATPAAAAATSNAAAPSDAAAPSPTPAAAVPAAISADTAVSSQLHELANGKFDRILGGKKERATFEGFYSGRSYAPLWITDGKANARAKAAIAYLGQVDADGLDPADYPTPDFTSLTDPAALAEAELKLTMSVVTYAHHAQVGRVHWSRVSGDIFYDQKAPNPADVLAKVAQASDVVEALAAYEPHAAGYVALKAKLAELRAGKEVSGEAVIANGPVLKIGMQDDRVPLLRERLHVSGDGTTYDKALAGAVAKYQKEHEQKTTGMLTPATVEALNGRKPDRPIDTIIANLERWRWMPRDLGSTYVMVNLPDFTLRVVQNGHQLWMTKIVDGKPNLPTPIMSAEMRYITVNPTWNVPPSIVAREYMPVLQQDSTALERMGLKVSTNPDGTVHIAQPPGERNALGRLRFNFPNKFLVYQHDTPEKQLFAYDKRAFSHGCMRVQDPVKYAEVLLSIVRPHDGYTQERIRSMFANNEQDIQFPTLIPVHLTYQTAFVDNDGKLQFREDVYGRDKALLAILKGDERKVADIPIERKENVVRRELLAMPEQTSFFGGRGGGGDFFSRLFGAPAAQPQPGVRRRSAFAQ